MNISIQRFSFPQLTGILLLALIAFCQPALADDDISLSATLSSSSVAVGDSTTLSITVNGAGSADIRPPETSDIILTPRGQSSQFQSINGSYSASITQTYDVQGTHKGTFTIPAFTVHAGNKTLSTEPLTLTVTDQGQIPSGQQSSPQGNTASTGKNAFLLIEGAKQQVYNGQQMPLTIRACFVEGLRVDSVEPPHLNGEAFVLSPLSKKPIQSTEIINNRRYIVLTWQTTASGIKEGSYPISASLEATVLVPQQRVGSRDPFFDDDFFNNFFDNYKKRSVTISSEPQQIEVSSLPKQGQPENFTGAIGNFALSVTASPVSVQVGDPITLTITVSGKGNFDRVNAPVFPENGQWKTYTPSSSFTDLGDNTGKKVFEQAVIADSSTIKELPALHFSYFDPKQGHYETKSSLPIPLQVKGASPSTSGTTLPPGTSSPSASNKHMTPVASPSKSTVQTQSAPLRTVRLETGNFVQEIKPIYTKIWFIIIVILCSFLLLILLLRLLVLMWLARKKSAIDDKKQHKALMQQSMQLEKRMKENDSTGFLQESRSLIQQLFARQLHKEPSTITAADLQALLPQNSPLLQLLQIAEQQAYAAMTLSQQEMQQTLDTVRTELENLL